MTDSKTDAGGVSLLDAERHPGPFSGPDAEFARACAMAVIPWYGNDDAATHQRIMRDGVWNDHIAVQAALAAIHTIRRAGLLGSTPVPCDGEAWQALERIANHSPTMSDFPHDIDGVMNYVRGILATPPARSDAPAYRIDIFEAVKRVSAKYPHSAPGKPWLEAFRAELPVEANAMNLLTARSAVTEAAAAITHDTTTSHSIANRFTEIMGAKIDAAKTHQRCDAGSGEVPIYEFPYQQTFDAIVAATDVLSGPPNQKQLSVSVKKFQDAFNCHRDRRAAPPPSGVREALARPWVFEEGNGSSPDEPELLPCIADANGVVLMQIYLDPYESPRVEEKMAAMKAAVSAINSVALSQLPATDEAGRLTAAIREALARLKIDATTANVKSILERALQ